MSDIAVADQSRDEHWVLNPFESADVTGITTKYRDIPGTAVSELQVAEVIIGEAVFIFATISILFNILIPEVEQRAEQDVVEKHKSLGFFCTSLGFLFAIIGIATISGGIISPFNPGYGLGLSPTVIFVISSLSFVASIALPGYATIYTSGTLFFSYRSSTKTAE